jgi:uncharacterized membrane protein
MRSDWRASHHLPASDVPDRSSGIERMDDPLARAVGLVLQWGVICAAVIVASGGAVFLRVHGSDAPHFREFHAVPAPLSTVMGAVRAAIGGDGAALMQCGVLTLIATPVARVVMLLVGFVRQRNWLYVTLSGVVLGALAIGIVRAQ